MTWNYPQEPKPKRRISWLSIIMLAAWIPFAIMVGRSCVIDHECHQKKCPGDLKPVTITNECVCMVKP